MRHRKPRGAKHYVEIEDGALMLEKLAIQLRAKGGKPCLVDVRVNLAFWYAEEGAPVTALRALEGA